MISLYQIFNNHDVWADPHAWNLKPSSAYAAAFIEISSAALKVDENHNFLYGSVVVSMLEGGQKKHVHGDRRSDLRGGPDVRRKDTWQSTFCPAKQALRHRRLLKQPHVNRVGAEITPPPSQIAKEWADAGQ